MHHYSVPDSVLCAALCRVPAVPTLYNMVPTYPVSPHNSEDRHEDNGGVNASNISELNLTVRLCEVLF